MKVTGLYVEADMAIHGVYNYNNMNGNLKQAKQDKWGIDFTSGTCISHEAYRDIVPRQPATEELANQYHLMTASPYYPRGFVVAGKNLMRSSAITVLDAYTQDKYLKKIKFKKKDEEKDEDLEAKAVEQADKLTALFYEQRTSSKPKETGLVSTSKHKEEGAQAKDTSLFARENAGERLQRLKLFIQLESLEFVCFEAPGFKNIESSKVEEFSEAFKATFRGFGVDDTLNTGDFVYSSAIIKTPLNGIQLSQEQRKAFIFDIVERYLSVDAFRANSRLRCAGLTKIEAHTKDEGVVDLDINGWKETIISTDLHDFYQKA